MDDDQPHPTLAVVCSVHDEEDVAELFHDRLAAVLDSLEGRYRSRLFFVENGSQDGTLEALKRIRARDPRVFICRLSRDFGYQCALEQGLRVAAADLYVIIDVDCEDPPEMIPEFLAHHEAGHDIVYGERLERPEPGVLQACRKVFYRLTRLVADDNFVLDMAEFSLFTREVRDAILEDNNSFPFLRASIGRIGFRRKRVPYRREARIAGRSHYNVLGMFYFAVAGILSATTLPLRLTAFLAPVVVLALWLLAFCAGAEAVPWQVAIGLSYLTFAAASIAIYTARIYKNGLHRPNSIVRKEGTVLPASPPGAHA